MGTQATGYKKIACGHPDRVTAYYTIIHSEVGEAENFNEVFDHLCKEAGEAGLETNSIIFHHAMEYQNKLNSFFTKSKQAKEALHDRIVMEDIGATTSNDLGIAVYLVDMLPTILMHLAFHTSTPELTGFYAGRPCLRMNIMDIMHMPPLQSNWKALDWPADEKALFKVLWH